MGHVDAYTPTPWPDVDAYIRAHPWPERTARCGPGCSRSPRTVEDDAPGEGNRCRGAGRSPIRWSAPAASPTTNSCHAWERSPWAMPSRRDWRSTCSDPAAGNGPRHGHPRHKPAVHRPWSARIRPAQPRSAGLLAAWTCYWAGCSTRWTAGGARTYVLGLSSDHGVARFPSKSSPKAGTEDASARPNAQRSSMRPLNKSSARAGPHVAAFTKSSRADAWHIEPLRLKPGGLQA